jgi:hypothetical protein
MDNEKKVKAGTNYGKGKIYKIVSDMTDKIYIGSTTKDYLKQRLSKHKYNYKQWLNGKTNYMSSFEIVKNEDATIVLLESYPCNSKDQLLARERFYIEENKNLCINKQIPGRSQKEYAFANKDKCAKIKRKHYDTYTDKMKERAIIHYNENKEKVLERQRNNRDKINKRRRE